MQTIALPDLETLSTGIWPWALAGLGLAVVFLLGRWSRPRHLENGPLEQRLQSQERSVADTLAGFDQRAAAESAALRERLTGLARQQETVAQTLGALQGVLANKQARGAFGETQLQRLIADLLPAGAFRMQAPLGTYRVDCLIRMPFPPGPVPIDAKFPLEGFQAWVQADGNARQAEAALKQFRRDVSAHVDAIAGKYIIPGQTADFALMFVPSEAVFAAIHSECRGVVEAAHRRRVFPVSPSTLWPVLNTLAAVLQQVRFQDDIASLTAGADRLARDSQQLGDAARRVERDWQKLSGDLKALIAVADTLSHSGRAFLDAADKRASEEPLHPSTGSG